MDGAVKELLNKLKDAIETLHKIKVEKKWKKDKEDLIAGLNVTYNKYKHLQPSDKHSNGLAAPGNDDDGGEVYDDVARSDNMGGGDVYDDVSTQQLPNPPQENQELYDDTALQPEPPQEDYNDVQVSQPAKEIAIRPVACEDLRDAAMFDFLELKKKNILAGAWQRRWYVLHKSILYVYDSSKDKKQKDAFVVTHYVFECRSDITKETKRKDRCFELRNPQTGKSFEFCASDKDHLNKWKAAFDQASKISPSPSHDRMSLPEVPAPAPSPTHSDKKINKMKFGFSTITKKIGMGSNKPVAPSTSDEIYDDTAADAVPAIQGDELYTDTAEGHSNYDDTATMAKPPMIEPEAIYDDTDEVNDRQLPPIPALPTSAKSMSLPPPPPAAQSPGFDSSTTPSRPVKSPSSSSGFRPPLPSVNDRESGSGTYRGKRTSHSNEEGVSGSGTFKGSRGSIPSERDLPPPPPSNIDPPANEAPGSGDGEADYVNLYQGLWDCMAEADDELAFKRGEIVHIISRDYESYGWWIGKKDGVVGLVPKEYLMEAYEI
ncbi:unnamed protein product [Clavelina lepadiformis]|uniref:Src kinase-associated phosphoprotein 2 n=1 Tax=Clavelina lepadiformis TaxID=159417 RepID=A0ABP0GH54_CLALP